MPPNLLMRMLMWVRRPPSRNQRIAIAIIVGVGLLLVGIEYLVGWPEWLTPNQIGRRGLTLP